jgi:hypothetical protein
MASSCDHGYEPSSSLNGWGNPGEDELLLASQGGLWSTELDSLYTHISGKEIPALISGLKKLIISSFSFFAFRGPSVYICASQV